MHKRDVATALLGSVLGLIACSAQAYEYREVVPIFAPSGYSSSYAYAINNHGVIVGALYSSASASSNTPFIYQNGALRVVETPGWQSVRFTGLNDVGDIVGVARTSASSPYRAIHYKDGVITDLGTLGGVSSSAVDVNNLGQIVGSYTSATGQTRPFLYSDGQMIELPITYPDGESGASPKAINDNGQIVGQYRFSFNYGSWIYRDGQTTRLQSSYANGMNAAGDVVGSINVPVGYDIYGNVDYDMYPFLYSGDQMTNLGLPESYRGFPAVSAWANAINSHGQIVGEYSDSYDDRYYSPCRRPCVFVKDGDVIKNLELLAEPTDLNIWIYSVRGINDLGQIVGNGSVFDSGQEIGVAYLYNPVPLPAGVWLLVSGLGALALCRRPRGTSNAIDRRRAAAA